MTYEDKEAYIWYWGSLMEMDIGERSFYFTVYEHFQDLTRTDEAEIHKAKISDLESKLMKAEYDLAENEKFTDGLIEQKVTAERELILNEIEQWALKETPVNFNFALVIGKLNSMK